MAFSEEKPSYIIPDAEIAKENGRFIVRLFDDLLPKPVLNSAYQDWCHFRVDKETHQYYRMKLRDAKHIISSFEKRKLTLYQVITAIVKVQQEFLESGPSETKAD